MAIRNTLILVLLISLLSCSSDRENDTEKTNPYTRLESPKERYEIPEVFFQKDAGTNK